MNAWLNFLLSAAVAGIGSGVAVATATGADLSSRTTYISALSAAAVSFVQHLRSSPFPGDR